MTPNIIQTMKHAVKASVLTTRTEVRLAPLEAVALPAPGWIAIAMTSSFFVHGYFASNRSRRHPAMDETRERNRTMSVAARLVRKN
jgi:hypothetical protein